MIAIPVVLMIAMLPTDDPLPPMGTEVVAVARIDLSKLHVEDLTKRIIPGVAPPDRQADLLESAKRLDGWVRALREARAQTLLIVLDMADFPAPPIAMVPVGPDADRTAIARLLTDPRANGPIQWPSSRVVDGVLVAGSPQAVDRYAKGPNQPRPDLAEALARSGDGPIVAVLMPNPTQRRVLEEQLPNLPREMGGSSTIPVVRGVRSVGLSVRIEPKATLRIQVQGEDGNALEATRRLGQDLLKYLADRPGSSADVARDLAGTPATIERNTLTMEIALEQATNLVSTPLIQTQEASGRSRCTNNLKQIALAMHNYHAVHNTFPPAYLADKAGKPLLSWRVLILPYLEQDELYKQFHLDEPWDSPHNRPLAARIPSAYLCPSSPKRNDQYRTTYLTPRSPSTIFPGISPVKIQEVTDGTSNTILVVDVPDDQAVVWTRPDDWETGPEPKLPAHHAEGTNASFADGSVHFLKATILPKSLLKLLTRNGGEVISANEF